MPLSLPDSLSARESAFFLDFDGTLAELAETPNDVRLIARARAVLDGLVQASNRAVAVISGRSIEGLDALLAPLKLPLAGVHGAERRAARGAVFRAAADRAPFGWMHQALEETVRAHPGMLLEHKGAALALHSAPRRAMPRKRSRRLCAPSSGWLRRRRINIQSSAAKGCLRSSQNRPTRAG